ncbi:BRO-e [Mamestra configurata nucleopolyhedrovirus A]|uniref:BRO-e n=2 Tax=Mamestra configurata nucleopolyhedrovirus TaxID=207830 RepID=Q8QLE4_NPVMC|nr:BRO-e [Mamestra configurata nucleopolyhedrovirus A]UVZ34925.1 BRO-E [Melanchra picta nucleopolyhedrovirus]AAM09198.1 BRO-e [Mamestra configurata nucleopolyhedrovirus A]QNH90570.1 bro-e [Mamestra configurata nucleopolyhedrovirus A]QNH90902.1 bro-e [Mamestra configurata nucleopolyhedrovirus A]UVZ35096.1 BRO-E [Melanchra picta nucleopolyhedrovirus]
MVQLKVGFFKFGEEEFELRYVVDDNKNVKFVAKDIALMLKYEDPKGAVQKHVDTKYKTPYQPTCQNNIEVGAAKIEGGQNGSLAQNGAAKIVGQNSPLYLHPSTWMITKAGVIQLIMKSKLPHAVELQEWLLEEVIPQVLCTGKYNPAISSGEDDESYAMRLYKDFQLIVQKKDEQLQQLTARIQKMSEQKDQVIHRIMNDMNRMYTGFQDTMQKKDEIMAQKDMMMVQKDEQVSKMIDRMVDLSGRAVQYPANDKKLPMICIAKNNTTFQAITGQRPYVEQQKHKRSFDEADIIVEEKRPNPVVDWNNAMHEASLKFSKDNVKRLKRSVYFDLPADADKFKIMLQQMLTNNNNKNVLMK